MLKFYHNTPKENIIEVMNELYAYLDANNYKYGAIIARFLIAEFGESSVNYHEAYVELL